MNESYEHGDTVIYNNKKHKVVKRIGYYDNNKEKLIYDYILFNGEQVITVSEKDINKVE